MLEQVCDFVHNYFEDTFYQGEYTISGGTIDMPFLENGQRFKIRGSALNDGIYTYRDGAIYNDDGSWAVELQSETFSGSIATMNVPHSFSTLVDDIREWVTKNGAVLDSPYTSESFGGYTYSKAGGSGANAGGMLTWQDKFRTALKPYRKIA